MNREIKKLWIAALRSGEYEQGKGQLRTRENTFCCLGILCNLHAQAHPATAKKQVNPQVYLGSDEYLPSLVAKWAGLQSHSLVINGAGLASINDGYGKNSTFAHIADLIEKYL